MIRFCRFSLSRRPISTLSNRMQDCRDLRCPGKIFQKIMIQFPAFPSLVVVGARLDCRHQFQSPLLTRPNFNLLDRMGKKQEEERKRLWGLSKFCSCSSGHARGEERERPKPRIYLLVAVALKKKGRRSLQPSKLTASTASIGNGRERALFGNSG